MKVNKSTSESKPPFDPGTSLPKDKDIISMWQGVKLESLEIKVSLDFFLDSFEYTHVNGGVRLERFKLHANKVLDWYLSRNMLRRINFFYHFVKNIEKNDIFGEIVISEEDSKLRRYNLDVLDLDCKLVNILISGGAYRDLQQSNISDLKFSAVKFIETITEGRYKDFTLVKTNEAWSEWFYGIAWDITYLIYDKLKSEVWLLAITDTD